MGENTKIAWADHTWNAWTGCSKVSPACASCYAERWANRSGLVVWGESGTRRRTSAAKWREPYKWNERARQSGIRERVFVNSLSDWAEDRDELIPIRRDMFRVIQEYQHLDFLLLTKRADRIAACLPDDWGEGYPNVWLGVTAENQEWAERRIPALLVVPAAIHFASIEPLLGPIDLEAVSVGCGWRSLYCACSPDSDCSHAKLDWVIVGGESGPKARPMNPKWARSLREQCRAAGVAYFFKQWGEFSDSVVNESGTKIESLAWVLTLEDLKRRNKFHRFDDGEVVARMGRKTTGDLLDGQRLQEMPDYHEKASASAVNP